MARDGDGVPPWLVMAGGWSWRLVAVALAIYVVAIALARLAVVTLPVVIALILTSIAAPAADALRRRGLPDAAAAGVVVIGGLTALIGLGFAVAPSFADQVEDLTPTIRDGVNNLLEVLAGFGYDEVRLEELLDQARETASGSSSAILSGLAGGLATAISGLTGLLLLLVLLFFFVKDGDEIVDWMIARTPQQYRDAMRAVGHRAWTALGGYVRGTALIALVDAAAIGIGLAIIGVPLVLPLALLVFLGAFLPVIGATIAGLLAVLVALAAGGLTSALLSLAVVVGVQQLEGNVLQPMIMRRAVALHPVVVLTALAVGASIAGIVGAFLSLPVAAVAAAVGNELRLRSESGDDPSPATV